MSKEKFEDFLKQVEKTIEELEGGELGLEAAMTKYETGMKALKKCHEILNSAEKKIEVLLKDEPPDEKGELKKKDFQ